MRSEADRIRWTEDTLLAVRELASAIGLEGSVRVFDPSWFVWLPEPEMTVGGLQAEVGRPAPPPGEIVFIDQSAVAVATVVDAQIPPVAAESGWVVEIGGVALPVELSDLARPTVDAGALAELRLMVPENEATIPGVLRLASRQIVVEIPASSIQAGADGALCAYLVTTTGYRVQVLQTLESRSGFVQVTGDLAAGQEVLVNPAEVLESEPCATN